VELPYFATRGFKKTAKIARTRKSIQEITDDAGDWGSRWMWSGYRLKINSKGVGRRTAGEGGGGRSESVFLTVRLSIMPSGTVSLDGKTQNVANFGRL